jgi:hypothetical protein
MIGKGAQYLTAAGFGRYRITAASLGSLVMLGKFWLTAATKQAIMDAFGVDGTAVIAATNEYLNGIAAQGQAGEAKATALAGFINEDPMMVCNLPIEVSITMPQRRLIPNSGSYIKTTVNARTAELSFDCVADLRGMSGYPATLFGVIDSYNGGSGMYGFINHGTGGNAFRYGAYNSNYVASGVANNTDNVNLEGIVTASAIELKVNGVSKGTATKGTPDNTNIYIFGANCRQMGGYYGGNQSRLGHLQLYTPSGDVGYFIPCMHNGVAECLDLVSCIIQERVGSFTIPDISYTPTP